jgi:hypothetical protein
MRVDLDDTHRCPVGAACESCGTASDLGVAVLDCVMGVFCLTLCGRCVRAGRVPTVGLATAALMVLAHCEHLGIDLDRMAAIRSAEQAD